MTSPDPAPGAALYAPDLLAGRVAVVTGTSPNIGGVMAAGLAAAGAVVACNDVDPDTAKATAERIVAAGGTAEAVAFDVTDEDAAGDAVAGIAARHGRIDILVNNAVKFDQAGLLDMTLERYRRQLDIILGGAFIMTRAAASAMIAGGIRGTIVNVLSTAAWQGQAGNVGYSTAKSGLINFTRSVAMELAPHGIRVNGFTPTATQPDDPELAAGFQRAVAAGAERRIMDFAGLNPWERLPTPADYVAPLIFLCSDGAGMMTGTNLTVDGGALARYWPQFPRRAGS
ncbi:MAG: SDR family NAD(P)-dependent oxidoreductase [Acidimicrobiales bacterium]